MKQAVTLPTLAELDSLLDESYWKAQNTELPKELLTLKKAAASSLASLAEAAQKLNTKTPFHTPRLYFRELYALIIAVHQDDAKALRLQAEIKFKISIWHWEQQLTLALQSQDIATQSKACLELGLLHQHSSEERRYEQALSYFSKVITLGCLKETPVALRKRAELYLEKGFEDLGLQDLQALCHLAPDNPRAQIEYGQALMVAERHIEAAKAAEQALALRPNDPAANDLLQMAQRHLSARELKVNLSVTDISPKHEARDELHAIYLKRLTSNVPSARQDGFSQLMAALEPCKGEIKSLLEVMNPEKFETLLESAPLYFEIEMPSHADTLQSDCRELHARFEDCLVLYLVAKSFMPPQHQIKFYHNMSRVLAKKGYYYQDAAVKNTGNPVDALDYALLALPYDSPDLLPLYERGAEQIVVEYHYQQGMAVLKLAEGALHNSEKTAKETDIEDFLTQFEALLKVATASQQYPHSAALQALQQGCCRYLSSPALLAVFETTFRFKLKHHATNAELLRKTFPTLLALIQSWGQHDLPSAKKGLRLFNGYLAEKKSSLSKDIFYTTAIEQINGLLLQFEKNQSLSLMTPQALPDMTRLIEETRKRFSGLLTIGQDLNTSSVIALQKRISEEALVILNSFLSAIENTLGPAPCAFSILGLGSYSRGEMGLCSDIDFAILVSDESSVQHPYFKSFLSLLVHLRRGLPANVLTIESKDLQTLFGQEKSLMHTPEEMVSEHCPLYTGTEIKSQKDRLTNTESYSVRRARLIFNSQTQPQESKALYEDYQRLLTKQLQTLDSVSSIPYYQMVGQVCLEEDFKKHDGAGLMATTETTTAINLKKTHLRPLTLWLLNVATYFGIAENNSWAILDALNQQSRIAPVFLQELGEALTTLHRLRLKLHHAWLTQPRSAELPFDAWLEMPTNDNTSPPTRDFYLDATQRETLDAIQRRIIEPLTETISVFGATLPPLQFDPVVHYFETQFKALNQKHIVESHCKILPALAEIALRHPSLLRPSLTFRDLLPQIKIGYLDALEVALQAMERPGSTKEIAELKALVKTLWHYPTEDGWRAESIRLEREWNQRLMRLVIAKALSGTSNTLSLVQDNGLKHYTLKPKIASQLLTEQGEWRLKDEKVSGNHLVYRIMDKGTTETLCWAKVYPEQPGIEWLMLQLDQRLGIYGIPASTLINIHHNGRNSAVLLSADVPHPNLLETIKNAPQTLNNLNRAHFFKTLIRVLLTNPEDDKGDDYFLKSDPEGLKLIRIDNERAFFTPEASEGILKTQKLQVKSIVYCLDLLMEPIKTDNPNVNAAVRDFLQLKPYALLKSLLLELKVLQPLWQALFSEADIEAHYHNKRPWLSLPILYVPQEMVKELSVRMDSLQTLLALNPKTTGLQLLSTVQPKLAAHYLQGFKQYQNNQNAYSEVMARFDLSPGRQYKKQEQGLYSLHGTAAVTQSLRLSGELSLKVVKSIWQGKAYTADAILEQIEHWEADRSKKIYDDLRSPDPAVQKKAYVGWQQLSNRQRVLLFKNFSEGIRKNSISDIRLQQAILAALPNTTFHTLDLSAFHVSLEDKLLTSILKAGGGHLIELTLNGCQKLSDAIPGIIAENCPNLKVLNACNMGWKSFATGRNRRSPIQLSKVERLETQNCQALERFIVEASQVDINLQGCIALKYVQFSPNTPVISAKEAGEFQYQLANAYVLGESISKNLAQSYYWAQLALGQNHPGASKLCGEYEYTVAKSYLLGDGVLKDTNQAYHWARLSREHQHPLSAILCYALFNNYAVTPLNGSDESIAAEKATVSLVGESVFTSIQTFKNADVKTLELKNINTAAGFTLLSLALAVNSTLKHLDLRENKIGAETQRSAEQALALKPNGPTANGLLQMAQRRLSAREPNVNAGVSDIPLKYEARDELHAIYLKRLISNVPSARQDGFSQLMAALEPCKGEIKNLLEVMNPANFEMLLESAPLYFDIEMPSHADMLQSDCRELHARFEDCLVLYLVAKSFMPPQHQIKFYHNMSRILAQKGCYYHYSPINYKGNPVDALDYALLALPYDSPDLLLLYAAGVEQIVMEYHYQQGMAVLKSAESALQNCEDAINEQNTEDFLKYLSLLLKAVNTSLQYPHSVVMQALQQAGCRYLSSPALLATFEKTFRFKLKYHITDKELLTKEFPTLFELINAWGQHVLENAKIGLLLFNRYLVEKKPSLSKDAFYTAAIEKTNELLFQFEKGQPLTPITPQALPDMTCLTEEARKRFASLLTIGQDLNARSVIALQKQISEEATVILNSFLSAIESALGPAPCAFSILGLGSYSRIEMSLCSDIDFAILVSDESSVQHPYFKSFLSLLVHLRRGLPPNVLTIESRDLQTLFGQEKSLMHTPAGMVGEHCPLYTVTEIKSQKDRLTNTESYSVRRARLIFNSQTQSQESKALYEEYQSRLKEQLQTLDPFSSIPYYQMVGQVCLEEDFKKHDGAWLIDATETTAINLKRTHLRPLTLWLLNVATYFGIVENNSWAILDALNQQSRIAPVFLQELREVLTYVHTLRFKLHHAWLTQPRPPELSFDTWLEMPKDYDSSQAARDFYLDAIQREVLDAIRQRIIDPLTETTSFFGAALSVPQFDPAIHYFEAQLRVLNQENIVEPHRKILSALAEIALSHPHLLTPSPAFRDLAPTLKVVYLDALEVALKTMEQTDSKEIAELKTLVRTLWYYPTEDDYGHKVDAMGIVALAEALKANSALQHLNLESNAINDAGAAALGRALEVNSTLQSLDLGYNVIGAAGATALSKALLANTTLQRLDLEGNAIRAAGAIALEQALQTNRMLQHLDLRFNNIGAAGATALGKALEVNSTLQSLDLGYNVIGAAGATALSKALLVNTTLLSLDLKKNNLNYAEGQKILNQIKEYLDRNKQNAKKQSPAQKPLPSPKPLETKNDSAIPLLVAFQYEQQALNARRPSINLQQDEEFTRTLEAELSNYPETPGSLSEQSQASPSNEYSNTVPTTPVIPLVFPRAGNVSLNNQARVISTEEKRAFKEKLAFSPSRGES